MTVMKYIDFKDIISMIKVICDECMWHFTEDGLIVRSTDYANVALINLHIPIGAFETYTATTQDFKVDIEKLKKFTDMTYGYVEIKQVVGDQDNLIIFTSGKYSLKLNQIECDLKKEPVVPSIDFKSSTVIKSSDMRKFLKGFRDGIVKVNIKNGSTRFRIDDYFFTTDTGVNGNSISTYSLDYFKNLFRYVKGDVQLEISIDAPCKIHLNLNGINIGYYLLAPRINQE